MPEQKKSPTNNPKDPTKPTKQKETHQHDKGVFAAQLDARLTITERIGAVQLH